METRYNVYPDIDFMYNDDTDAESIAKKHFQMGFGKERVSYTIKEIAERVALVKMDLHATGITVERTHNYNIIKVDFFEEDNNRIFSLELSPVNPLSQDAAELKKLLDEDDSVDKWLAKEGY